MTRVLHITRDFPPRTNGGISVAVGGLARALQRAGIDCAALSFDGWRPSRTGPPRAAAAPADEGGLAVLRVSTPDDLPAARAFASAVRPALLHVHHGMLWPFATELRDALGARALFTVHVAQTVQQRLRGIAGDSASSSGQRAALAGANLVHAPSRAAADALLADDPSLSPRLAVAGLGVDDSPAARAAAAARPAHPGGPVTYVGRFADVNGTGELWSALPRILASAPGARAVIAGGLPDNRRADARWRRRWDADTPPDARDRTRFTGWLPHAALAEVYSAAGVLIAPSWFETFGLVVLEAMLHGAPIVASRAGGIPELISDGETGLLVPPRDPGAIAGAALELLADLPRARRLGEAAAAEARAHHLWDDRAPAFARLYEAL